MTDTSTDSLPPTSRDVAVLAGVSQKTVSRVFNDEPYVSSALRTRVLDAADRLRYRPNTAARALASGRSRSIGVISLGTELYGPSRVLVGLERASRDLGYSLRVAYTRESDSESTQEAAHSLLAQGVDGIIIVEPIDESVPPVRLSVPMVAFGSANGFSAPVSLSVGVGYRELAQTVTEHLLDLGHLTVHHLAGPLRWFAARDRRDGWRAALKAAGRQEPDIIQGDWSARSGFEAGHRISALGDVTAVFAANDEMAIGFMRALVEAGRRVPDDVSVVGFDDISVSAYTTPPLTTVRPPLDAVAHTAIEHLVEAIEGSASAGVAPFPRSVELTVRGSTGPPPSPQKEIHER